MTTVFIWNNNLIPNKLNPQKKHVVIGHAAVNIADTWVRPDVDDKDNYVSFWPGGGHFFCTSCNQEYAKEDDDIMLIRQGQDTVSLLTYSQSRWAIVEGEDIVGVKCITCGEEMDMNDLRGKSLKRDNKAASKVGMTTAVVGTANDNFWRDLTFEGYAPDHIIRITDGNAHAMRQLWKELRQRKEGKTHDPHYKAADKNCSRMASRVLRAGWNTKILGMDLNIRFGNWVRGIWTPLQVKRLAMSIKGAKTLTWTEFADEISSKNALPPTLSLTHFKKWYRRASNRGSSEATPRFDFRKGHQHAQKSEYERINDEELIFPP